MPVSLRTDDDPIGGNRFAGARIVAPVGERDPARRIADIRQQALTAVAEPAINMLSFIAPIMSRLPTPLLASMSSASGGPDIQASNIPGYPHDTYVAGARITKLLPFGPLPGVPMMIILVTQAGICYVGAHYDSAAITDAELFAQCLRAASTRCWRSTRRDGRRRRALAADAPAAAKTPSKTVRDHRSRRSSQPAGPEGGHDDRDHEAARFQSPRSRRARRAHYVFHAARIADTLADADGVRRFAAKLPGKRPIHNEDLLRASLPTPRRASPRSTTSTRRLANIGPWRGGTRWRSTSSARQTRARLRHARSLLALDRTTDAAELLRPVFDAVQTGGEIGGVLFAGARVLSALAGGNWRGALDARQLSMLRQWARLLRCTVRAGPDVEVAGGCAGGPPAQSTR